MVRVALGAGVFLALTCAALVLSAPAAIMERMDTLATSVRVGGCSGRLWWKGSCRMFLRSHDGWASAGLISFSWRVDRDSGLYLALDQDGRTAGTVQPSLNGWSAKIVEFRLPAVPIGALPNAIFEAWKPTARFAIVAPLISCDWGASSCGGQGRIRIENLSAGKAASFLGNYLMDIEIHPGGLVQGQLSTLSGPLALQGRFEKSRGQAPRIVGNATLGSGVGNDIRRFLEAVAQPDGANKFTFARAP